MVILLLQFSRVETFAWWRIIVTVEISGVGRSGELRLDRRVEFAIVKLLPFNVLKPWMCFHILGAPRQVAEPVCGVDGAELADDVFGFGRHSTWILDFARAYSVVVLVVMNAGSKVSVILTVRTSASGFRPRKAVGRLGTRK